MSGDILKPINKIKNVVNENDQLIWECQAATKCYNEATGKLREECDRLNKEIENIDEEIQETEPQISILESTYDVQDKSLSLIQKSLVNQKLYKKLLKENFEKHAGEANKVANEYSQYIQTCKEKLEDINPLYKTLQAKRTEVRRSKMHCMDIQQQINDYKMINKQKIEIRQKLFYSDIIKFALKWVNKTRYLEATSRLEEHTKKVIEYMQKLTEATELLKQKQRSLSSLRKQFVDFIIEFPENGLESKNTEKAIEKAKPQKFNNFANINEMLQKKDEDLTFNLKKSNFQKGVFNTNNSKVRILDNKIITKAQESEKPNPNTKSKEDKAKEIAANCRMQRIVQNFNKSISRQDAKRSIAISQKCQIDTKIEANEKFNQQANTNQKRKNLDENEGAHEESGATQAMKKINLTNREIRNPNINFSNQCSKFLNKQQSYFNKEGGFPKTMSMVQRPQIDKHLENVNDKIRQQSGSSQERNNVNEKLQKEAYEGSGAPQAIKKLNMASQEIKSPKINFPNQRFNQVYLPHYNKTGDPPETTQPVGKYPNENCGSSKCSQDISSQGSTRSDKKIGPTGNTASDMNKKVHFRDTLDKKMASGVYEDKFHFDLSSSAFGNALTTMGQINQTPPLNSSGGYECNYNSPEICGTPEDENNANLNFSGVPNFTEQSVFSFGQSKFNFFN